MSTDGLELEQPEYTGAHTAAQRASQSRLNLDELERDDPAKGLPPFAFTLAGRDITLIDPVELDWNILSEVVTNPFEFARAAMNDDDRAWFESQKLPVWKVDKLMESYQAYYEIDPGKANG